MLVPLHTAHAPYAAGAKELPGWHCLLQHVSGGQQTKVTKRHESLGPPAPLTAAAKLRPRGLPQLPPGGIFLTCSASKTFRLRFLQDPLFGVGVKYRRFDTFRYKLRPALVTLPLARSFLWSVCGETREHVLTSAASASSVAAIETCT